MNNHHQSQTFRLARLTCALLLSAFTGCLAAPEHCRGCLETLADAGSLLAGDMGSEQGATGGTGAGGAAGDNGTGGVIGTGGVSGTGGVLGTGGQGTGGSSTGGSGTGGGATGGAGTGGLGMGGIAPGTGGMGMGGQGTGGVATGGGGAGGAGTDPDLVLWYKFDEASGTAAADSAMSGGTARDGTLMTIGTGASAAFSTTKQVGTHAVSLTPSATTPNSNAAFVAIPTLQTLAPNAITIAVWVNLTANTATQNWERVFDFGSGTPSTLNMYLTTRAADGTNTPVRFAITNTGHTGTAEQRLDGTTTLSTSAWHHIAVVLPAGATFTGTLYIDGVAVATKAAMTLHATDLGATTQNWLGRSQFSAAAGSNPGFNGLLDDFRVYRRALTQTEITALVAVH